MNIIGEAIKRPFTDFKKLVIGIILSIIPIINLFSLGYVMECAKSANKKDFELPKWKNFGDLFVNGFFVTLICAIYAIPLILYGIWIFGMTILKVIFTSTLPQVTLSPIPFIAWLFLLIITIYVTPAAILSFVFNKNLRSAFKIRKIFDKTFTKKYFKTWIKATIVFFAIIIILGGIGYLSQNKLTSRISEGISGFVAGISFITIMGKEW